MCLFGIADPPPPPPVAFFGRKFSRLSFLNTSLTCCIKGDESRCNTLAKTAFYPPIYIAVMTGAIGCTFLVVLMVVDSCCREAQGEKAKREAQRAEGAEVDKMIRCVKEGREVEGNYSLLHGAQGGVRMLIGASFTVLSTPQERHVMAKYILEKEVEIHGSKRKALRCLRSKGWSQKESYECLYCGNTSEQT